MVGDPQGKEINSAAAFRDAFEAFTTYIRRLPDAAVVEKAWGPKEVLAHIVFYLQNHVSQLEARVAGRPFLPVHGSYDDLNAQVVRSSRGVPIQELLRRLRVSGMRLAEFAQTHDPESLTVQLKKGSVPRALTRLLREEAGHIRGHLQTLAAQAERNAVEETDRLAEAVDGFCQFVRAIDDVRAADTSKEGWGPKEVLAHLLFWHEHYITQIEAQRTESRFELPLGPRDALNAQAVAAGRVVPIEVLLDRIRAADERLQHFSCTLDPQMVVVAMPWQKGVHRYTLDVLVRRVTEHVRGHQRELQRRS
jgi:hypothetical protein